MSSEDAPLTEGMSAPVGAHWFRKAGGMPPATFRPSAKTLSGRYLAFVEREEIALLRVQGLLRREAEHDSTRPHAGRERQIARHMIERYPVSALSGIEDIAQQSAVSAPTVTRFVRRLGFHRFFDFQRANRLEIQEQEASPLALLHQHREKSEDRCRSTSAWSRR